MTKFWIISVLFYTMPFVMLVLMPRLSFLVVTAAPLVLLLAYIWYAFLGPEYGSMGAVFVALPLFFATAGTVCGGMGRLTSILSGRQYLGKADGLNAAIWFFVGLLVLGGLIFF